MSCFVFDLVGTSADICGSLHRGWFSQWEFDVADSDGEVKETRQLSSRSSDCVTIFVIIR